MQVRLLNMWVWLIVDTIMMAPMSSTLLKPVLICVHNYSVYTGFLLVIKWYTENLNKTPAIEGQTRSYK